VKKMYAILAATILGSAVALAQAPARVGAQEAPPAQAAPAPVQAAPAPVAPLDESLKQYPNCGSWDSGTWVPSGACGAGDYRSHVAGTITAVKGHLVTLQQSTKTMVINDKPALDEQTTGRVGVGRVVTAYGYWRDGVFYATRIV
jgi:hypothetical protein